MHVTVGELIGNFILIAGSFILLLVLIKKFAWSNITGIFEERAEKIASDIDRAEEARQKAEVLAQKREDELAGSRKEAKTIIENAKETAEKSKASILADAKLEAGRLKEKANQEIAQNKAEALQSVKGEVADLTISLAGKIISQNLDGHAHKELIDQYIDQLGDCLLYTSFYEEIKDIGIKYDAVIGNPPYIRYQFLSEEQRNYQSDILKRNGMKPNKLINSWVAFTVASIELLSLGGKFAFVLPTDLLQVSYAKELRKFIFKELKEVTIIRFDNIVFSGIQQDVVLIFGIKSDMESKKTLIRNISVKDMSQLSNKI